MSNTANLDENIYQQDEDVDDPMGNPDDYDPRLEQDGQREEEE